MRREQLERHQVWLYLAMVVLGAIFGRTAPQAAAALAPLLWPLLGLLIYTTFTQMPLSHLRSALADKRFLAAALIGNFIALPVVLALLLPFVPALAGIQLGVVLVLLMPCTDWFISFSYLGRGNAPYAAALTPFYLGLQLLLLPVYLPLFIHEHSLQSVLLQQEMLWVFVSLIALPLLLAWLTQRHAGPLSACSPWRWQPLSVLAWLPVPLLALVVGVMAATQVQSVLHAWADLMALVPLFLIFLLAALLLAGAFGRVLRLPASLTRTLAFSYGTRNSFVVLPLALALPAELSIAAPVIVLQSLVELLGMLVFLSLVPRLWPMR